MDILSKILIQKIILILRGFDTKEAIEIVETLYNEGIQLVEITLNSPNAYETISEINSTFNNDLVVGAGTVLNKNQAEEAAKAGAKFIISPSLDIPTIEKTKELGCLSIPGAFTPTEIVQAHNAGADIVKVFPSVLGPDYIKNVLAPLSHIKLMPTGGITTNNIPAYLQAGAVAFGVGGSILNTEQQGEQRLLTIQKKVRNFIKTINQTL